jgi:type I restriction enzyme S subunit
MPVESDSTPKDWAHSTLGQFSGERGQNIEPAKTPEKQFELYSVPSFPEKTPEIVTGKEVGSNKQLVEPRSVLLCKINPRINRVWVVGDFTRHTIIASTEWIVFPPSEEVVPEFLCYFCQQNAVRDFLAHNASGVGGSLMRVKPSTLRDFPFAYPKPIEQRRIVAEIEKQFTRLDAGVAALKRMQANLKRYRAAVLKAACEGKLVPTEAELSRKKPETGNLKPEFETGEQLLVRILAERRKNWTGRGKYKDLATPDATTHPPLPDGWTWASSSQILREVKDGTHDTPAYHPTGIPFITQKHVKARGLVFEDYKFITKEDHEHFFQRSNPERGDILVSMIGVNRGESCIIDNDEVFSIKNVGLFKPNHSLSSVRFIQYFLSSRLGQQMILKESKGGAQPFIGLTELRAWSIPLPPLAEQTRIVAEVERRLSVVDELEAVLTANLQRATRLRQSILQRAFTGELAT